MKPQSANAVKPMAVDDSREERQHKITGPKISGSRISGSNEQKESSAQGNHIVGAIETSGNTTPRKPVRFSPDLRGIRPMAFTLQHSGPRLFREWIEGKRMRQMARNLGTTVDVVEDILREESAA